jgi:hypothetical protein
MEAFIICDHSICGVNPNTRTQLDLPHQRLEASSASSKIPYYEQVKDFIQDVKSAEVITPIVTYFKATFRDSSYALCIYLGML